MATEGRRGMMRATEKNKQVSVALRFLRSPLWPEFKQVTYLHISALLH